MTHLRINLKTISVNLGPDFVQLFVCRIVICYTVRIEEHIDLVCSFLITCTSIHINISGMHLICTPSALA